MIAKILDPIPSFAGIYYNERKNEQGKSELLAAENFSMAISNPNKRDYIRYLEMVCAANKKVKNVQFHAVISCKGREKLPEELKEVAQEYIKKMGYGNNPYLIYFHSDTDNNHVHIVSSRVDKNGNKIDDRFERLKSQKIINEIIKNDLRLKAKEDISKAMKYSYSTLTQFKLILERMGWKLQEKEGMIHLVKSGIKQHSISKDEIEHQRRKNTHEIARKKQIVALLHKDKVGLTHIELQSLLKDKFGLELVFHTGKGHNKPYGYTIIDHFKKGVYKGSDIMALDKLLSVPDVQAKIDHCNNVVATILESSKGATMESFKSEMKELGYRFNMDGKIIPKGETKAIISLDDSTLSSLRYNSRVVEANMYKAASKEEAILLSKLFFVNQRDIEIVEKGSKDLLAYSQLIQSYMYNSSNISDSIRNSNMTIVSNNGMDYLIDKENKVIISSQELGIPLSNRGMKPIIIRDNDVSIISDNIDAVRGKNIIDTLCDILSYQNYYAHDENRRRRKKGQTHN